MLADRPSATAPAQLPQADLIEIKKLTQPHRFRITRSGEWKCAAQPLNKTLSLFAEFFLRRTRRGIAPRQPIRKVDVEKRKACFE